VERWCAHFSLFRQLIKFPSHYSEMWMFELKVVGRRKLLMCWINTLEIIIHLRTRLEN
jgi:hypothetical protein